MWYLYLDESGDLGFDFVNKKPSQYFVICILATNHRETNQQFKYATRKTLKRKLNLNNSKRLKNELKGVGTSLHIKQYAWEQIKDESFDIYSVVLNKKKVYPYLWQNKSKVYNFIARLVVDKIPLDLANGSVDFIIDKSKNSKERQDFNNYILTALESRLDIETRINFIHESSEKWPGLQFVDMFSYGIFRKYEKSDTEWYNMFKNKIRYEDLYLKEKSAPC